MSAAALKHDLALEPLILVALPGDDERDMYEAHLQFQGFRLSSVQNGAQLVHEAIALQPHAVVVAQQLPPMGGEVACAQLRAHAQTASIPLVLIASYRPAPCPCDASMIRPVLPITLTETLRVLIERSGRGA